MTTQEIFEMLNTAARVEIALHALDNFKTVDNRYIFCNGRGWEYGIHLTEEGFTTIIDVFTANGIIPNITENNTYSANDVKKSFSYHYKEGDVERDFEVFALCEKEETNENV